MAAVALGKSFGRAGGDRANSTGANFPETSLKVLGDSKECMQSFAQHCLLSVQAPYKTTLTLLSLSDGYMNHSECVPTSVLLAHAFASLDVDALPAGLERIRIFGADIQNPRVQCLKPQTFSWIEDSQM